jgi:hypothetical protein
MSVPTYHTANIDALDYSKELMQMKTGAKSAPVSTVKGSRDPSHRLRVQLGQYDGELMRAPFGVSSPPEQNKDANRLALDISIESDELLAFLTKLDARNKAAAREHSYEWFKKQLTDAEIEAFYTPLVKASANPDYRPLLKTKFVIPSKNPDVKTVPTQVFVVTKETPTADGRPGTIDEWEPGTIDDITKGAKCIPIIEANSVWFAQKAFGMSLTVTHILVWPSRARRKGIEAFSLPGAAPPVEAAASAPPALGGGYFDPMDMGPMDEGM